MKKPRDEVVFMRVGGAFTVLFSILCLLPFVMLISGSLSTEKLVVDNGYSLLPQGFTLDAYKYLFMTSNKIGRSYVVTILTTAAAVGVGLILTSLVGFVFSRKDFAWRNKIALVFYFTSMFYGGLLPTYILMLKLGMKNNILSLFIGNIFPLYYAFLIRNYMAGLPDAISESAKIDGAGYFTIYLRVVLPLCTPVLATVGLFIGLTQWNEWYSAMLYVSDAKLFPLQYLLYQILNSLKALKVISEKGNVTIDAAMLAKPEETVKLATTVIATGPIILAYPFIQKYFVKGITIGAIKG